MDVLPNKQADLEVIFIDEGRVDSILIRAGDHYGFIDSGFYEDGVTSLQFIKNLGISKLDFYIATHGHANHCGGGVKIIQALSPDVVYLARAPVKNAILAKCKTKEQKKLISNANYHVLAAGETFMLGPAEFVCLGPKKIISCSLGETKENYNSLILKMTYGDSSFLFTGDTSSDILLQIEKDNPGILRSDVYKNAHHNGATSLEVLKLISPLYTVICCDRDISRSYTRRLEKIGSEIINVYSKHSGTTRFLYQQNYADRDNRYLVLNHNQTLLEDGGYTLGRNLQYKTKHMIGSDVLLLQYYLFELGYVPNTEDVDGDFGLRTRNFVRNYQVKMALHKDGIVTPKVWDHIQKYYDAWLSKTSDEEQKQGNTII